VVPAASARPIVELVLISFLVLFFELTCIRWFASTVVFLTFFTNIVLLACFLGVSVGCLASARHSSWMNAFVPLVVVATASAYGFWRAYNSFGQMVINVGSQQSPQLIYFGTDTRLADPSKWVVPIELVAGYFFVVIALAFIGPGQEVGRRFAAIDNRLQAYTADILGSLAGIAVFGVMSYFRAPALVWFLIAVAIGVYFVPRRRWLHALAGLVVLGVIILTDWPFDSYGLPLRIVWSPYYQIRFSPPYLSIDANNMGHQSMLQVDREGPGYFLPYLLARAAGPKPFQNVLVVGAGSGNDVAAALAAGVRHVDAVEIDPVINELGRLHHPNRPYANPRVTVHLDDGRSYLRKTATHYDMISYALVDSVALHSSYSSVHLESFLFTEEAFRDVKAKLKPGGVFAMYNFYRKGWVVGRLVKLAETVFGSRPIVISVPIQSVIRPEDSERDFITFLLVGNGAHTVVDSIRSKFSSEGSFWLNPELHANRQAAGFSRIRPARWFGLAQPFQRVVPAAVEVRAAERIPTDDWPFLYLRDRAIPDLNLRGIAMVAVLSLVILLAFAPVRRARLSGRMFFLGAGFMLVETKGVVHMALLFGATWVVNSIVFFSILTLVLLANVYTLLVRPRRLWPYYVLLTAALLFSGLVPMNTFLALPGASKVVASCAVVYMPVFFAGVIFAAAFRSSMQPDADFGSNIAGIVVGGLSEYLSLVIGFNHLLWVAVGYYVLSGVLPPRGTRGSHAVSGPAS
jgi:spermidine synthase